MVPPKSKPKKKVKKGKKNKNVGVAVDKSVPALLDGLALLIDAVNSQKTVPAQNNNNNNRNLQKTVPAQNNNNNRNSPKYRKKVLYLTNVSCETNEAQIVRYIKDKFNVHDLTCNVVVPWNKRRCDLNFINFKICVPENCAQDLLNQSAWPRNVRIRNWDVNSHRDDSTGFQQNRHDF